MRLFTPLLTLALTFVLTAGCMGTRGLERDFARDTADEFRAFHEAARGGAEMLGEAAVSTALAAGRDGTVGQLDDALLDLAAADLAEGNEALIAATNAINNLAASLSDVPVPATLSLDQVADIQEAHVFARAARDLAQTATDLTPRLGNMLRYEIESNERAADAATQALDLVERLSPAIARQHEIATGNVEALEKLSEEQAVDLVGPEYPYALRREVAPATVH